MKHNKQAAFGGVSPKQKKQKLTRKEKKAAKKADRSIIKAKNKRK